VEFIEDTGRIEISTQEFDLKIHFWYSNSLSNACDLLKFERDL
jgi:hypothetical protein